MTKRRDLVRWDDATVERVLLAQPQAVRAICAEIGLSPYLASRWRSLAQPRAIRIAAKLGLGHHDPMLSTWEAVRQR